MGDTPQTKVRIKPGAAIGEVASGGELDILSGGVLDVQTGAALKIGSVAVTATAAELNAMPLASGTYGAVEANKVAVLGTNKELDEVHTPALYLGAAAGTLVTATAAELNKLHASTAGTAVASKVAVLGADKELDEVHAVALYLGSGAGTLISPTAAQINLLAQGYASGYKVARGAAICTGTLDVVTGLTTVVAAIASLVDDPGVGTAAWVSIVAPASTAGVITLKTWKPTTAGNVTPIAGAAGANLSWLAVGT
jgi:hypothetical protein